MIVQDYQLSLAIGKEGQNARLAARLTTYKIDIKSETQARELGLFDALEYGEYEDGFEGEYEVEAGYEDAEGTEDTEAVEDASQDDFQETQESTEE